MLKLNHIDAKWISIVDANIKYFQNPLYFNASFFFPLSQNNFFFGCLFFVVILVQLFVLIGDAWAAEKWRLEVVDAQEHIWVRAFVTERGLGTWEEDGNSSLKLWLPCGRLVRKGVKCFNQPGGSEWIPIFFMRINFLLDSSGCFHLVFSPF